MTKTCKGNVLSLRSCLCLEFWISVIVIYLVFDICVLEFFRFVTHGESIRGRDSRIASIIKHSSTPHCSMTQIHQPKVFLHAGSDR